LTLPSALAPEHADAEGGVHEAVVRKLQSSALHSTVPENAAAETQRASTGHVNDIASAAPQHANEHKPEPAPESERDSLVGQRKATSSSTHSKNSQPTTSTEDVHSGNAGSSLLAALAPDEPQDHSAIHADEVSHTSPVHGNSLTGIRVRPLSHSLRVVLFFESPVPYVVRKNPDTGRVTIDMVNVRIESFESELNALTDSRLKGIWMIDAGPEISRLELRLGDGDIEVEDFALFDPPALVLDIFRLGDEFTELPREFRRPNEPVINSSHSALPPGLVGPSTPLEDAPQPMTAPNHAHDSHDSHSAGHSDHDAPHEDNAGDIVFAMREDYEGFPIDRIQVYSPEARSVLRSFLGRRWGTAFSSGLQYLEHDPGAGDAIHVLYLMAESRFQLSRDSTARNSVDAQNFYRQALLAVDSPDLTAFARRRLSFMQYTSGQYLEALYYIDQIPEDPSHPRIAQELRVERARVLEKLRSSEEVLTEIRDIFPARDALWVELGGATLEGRVLFSSGELEQAWEVMQHASAFDSLWWQRDIDSAEVFGRTARDMGDLEQALETYDYAVYSFMKYMNDRPEIFIDYADRLRRFRDRALLEGRHDDAAELDEEARIWYRRLLHIGRDGKRMDGIARIAQLQIARGHASATVDGETGYALYFLGRGEIHAAMEQLAIAKRKAAVSGDGDEALSYAASEILEPYLAWANEHELWHMSLVAWGKFGKFLNEGPARTATRLDLAKAMAELDMNSEALAIINGLLTDTSESRLASSEALRIQRANILNDMGRGLETLTELETLAERDSITSARVDATRTLARVYSSNEMPIQAAQTYELLARTNQIPSAERGAAWLSAGRLYLDQGLPRQTIEVGLRAIVYQEEQLEFSGNAAWDEKTDNRITLMLGRAFFELGDYRRATVLLEDYAARDGIGGGDLGLANYLLGISRSNIEDPARARDLLSASQRVSGIPKVWRSASSELLARLDYDPAERFEALFTGND